jgi:hypothetical protein
MLKYDYNTLLASSTVDFAKLLTKKVTEVKQQD